MKFHDFKTMQSHHPQEHVRRMSHEDWFQGMLRAHWPGVMRGDVNDQSVIGAMVLEKSWIMNHRPFYHAYPVVCRCLENTTLKFTIKQMGLRLSPTAICFAVGHEPRVADRKVESVVFVVAPESRDLDSDEEIDKPTFRMRINYADERGGKRDQILHSHDDGNLCDWRLGPHTGIAALCVGLTLLAKDERFAEPILLKRDEGRQLTPEQREAAIERAKRNGRNGIAIGKHLDASPHMRRPHFGIRWTEKGRSVPKLVPIKGCLVSRSKLYPIPTGYLDDELAESK